MPRSTPLERTRNIGIMAHIDAGKTTTTERILFYTGVNYKMGEVHDGAATMDWMEQEQERGITITSAATTCVWRITASTSSTHRGTSTSRSKSSARCACSTVRSPCSAASAASSRSRRPSGARRTGTGVPRIAFVNKMDRVGADFDRVVAMMRERLGANPVPIQIPIGSEDSFRGVVDVIERSAIYWDDDSLGAAYHEAEVPAELAGSDGRRARARGRGGRRRRRDR